MPGEVVLRQNTPNPFNPTTRIEFSVPEPQFVELLIYDVLHLCVHRPVRGPGRREGTKEPPSLQDLKVLFMSGKKEERT